MIHSGREQLSHLTTLFDSTIYWTEISELIDTDAAFPEVGDFMYNLTSKIRAASENDLSIDLDYRGNCNNSNFNVLIDVCSGLCSQYSILGVELQKILEFVPGDDIADMNIQPRFSP